VNFRDITDDIVVDIDYSFAVSPEVAITGYDMAQINARDVTVDVQIDGSRLRAFADGLREAGVVAGAVASALGNVGREAIQTAQRFERDLARLDNILEDYGCIGVRAINGYDRITFDVRFPEGGARHAVSKRLIEDSAIDWVEMIAQEFIDLVQQQRRENEPILELDENGGLVHWIYQYIDGLRDILAANVSTVYVDDCRLPRETRILVEFRYGEIRQWIRYDDDLNQEYVQQLWQDILWAKRMLSGDANGRPRQNSSIVSITPTQRIPPGFPDDFYHPRRGPYHNGSRFTDEENNRARDLLVSCLNDEQRKEFSSLNAFTVTGQSGEKYRIKHGKAFNVTRLSDKIELCAGPADNVPTYDYMLAQKIWLEADEAGFLEDANERRGFLGPFGGEVLNIRY